VHVHEYFPVVKTAVIKNDQNATGKIERFLPVLISSTSDLFRLDAAQEAVTGLGKLARDETCFETLGLVGL
jgi:hypothetical protein